MIDLSDIEIKTEKEEGGYGKFVIGPLPPGYGVTLGNSLRRVLLSSLEGGAFTEVSFEGVPHQFSTIPGVREDVVELTLNLKQVRMKVFSDEPVEVRLEAKGKKVVTAGDLDAPSSVEIVNLEHKIANLTSENAKISARLVAQKGFGYVPSEEKKIEAIGVIPLDAVFSPVRKVNLSVEETRIGQITNLDSLVLEIETDSSLSPSEALKQASALLFDYFGLISGQKRFEKKGEGEEKKEEEFKPREIPEKERKLSLEELGFSTRTINALEKAGIKTLGGLLQKSKKEIKEMKGLGAKAFSEVEKEIKARGGVLKEE